MLTSNGIDHSSAVGWVADQVGPIARARELTGGWTSSMLALQPADGDEVVLRLMDREPWRAYGAAMTSREAAVQRLLETTSVPAPRSLALDETGRSCGYSAHLMTLVPGAIFPHRFDDASLDRLVDALVGIHEVDVPAGIRPYESWAWEGKFAVPPWSTQPSLWEEAFELLRTEPPAFVPTFIHRDFQLRNVLWRDKAVSGVIDWVETSIGPAWLDVAHCCSHMATEPGGIQAAAAFAAAYTGCTGRTPQPYFDVMDIVAFLPAPGRAALVTDVTKLQQLEGRLRAVLRGRNTAKT